MSNLALGNIVFFIIMFTWVVYLVQDLFITGSSALNRIVSTNEEERKQVQVTTGLHFDGIEVWLIVALTMTLAAFPLVFSVTFSHLYIPIFLLLYALIARGVSIEVIYKIDSAKWVKSMVMAWTVSSILIMFVLGVYISNMFLGYPYVAGEMTKSFASIFNVTGISGGLFFVVLSLTAGAGWLTLTTEGELHSRALKFVKKVGIIYMVPILLLLVLMGLNNETSSIFNGELYIDHPILFALPGLLVLSAIGVLFHGYKEDGVKIFVTSLTTMLFFVVTGFVGMFPHVLLSRGAIEESIAISDAMALSGPLKIIIIAISIFFPIIIGYQTWKYIKFAQKIKLNDE
jgi:cytochrome d ubiquinol oxidase subunit II